MGGPKRSFLKDKPKSLYKLIFRARDKISDNQPFSLLKTPENIEYAETLVRECGVKEEIIQKILFEAFEVDSFIFDVENDPDFLALGEAVFSGYSNAINALEKLSRHQLVVADTSYSGSPASTLREAVLMDVAKLERKRKKWARLLAVRPHIREKAAPEEPPMPATVRRMLENQAYCVFTYLRKSIKKAGHKAGNVDLYLLLDELFSAIYSDPVFDPERQFHHKKIKEYVDNGKRYRLMKNTPVRKWLESL